MITLRRFFRRKKKKITVIVSLVSLVNLIFPQHVAAQTKPVKTAPVQKPAPIVLQKPAPSPVLPTVPSAPAKRTLRVVATAYTSSVDETDSDPFTTASGAKTADGIIAANGLPFGTKVRLPDHFGDKVFTVADRMGARHGKGRIDIWMTTKVKAKNWGVRNVRMEIL